MTKMNWYTHTVMDYVATKLVENRDGKLITLERTENPASYEKCVSPALEFIATDQELSEIHNDEIAPLFCQEFCKQLKSNEESSKLRDLGNKFFCSNYKGNLMNLERLERSLECYSTCIAYATPESKELALGYANRSAVLLSLNRPKECLQDCDRALHHNYPDELKPKLYFRQAQAYSKLAEHSCIIAKYWLEEMEVSEERQNMEESLKSYSVAKYKDVADEGPILPELKSPNEKIPCLSDAVDIVYSDTFGKRLVATRDIDIGEVLVIDKPYTLIPFERFSYFYCSNCLGSFFNGIPCDGCINTFYCSEECKKLAWEEYHQFECSLRDILLQYKSQSHEKVRIARLLLQMCHAAGGLENLRKRVEDVYNSNFQSDQELNDKWFRDRSLESILSMKTNVELVSGKILINAVANALSVLFHLTTATNFFKMQYEQNLKERDIVMLMSQNPDVAFVGGMLIKLGLLVQKYHHKGGDYDPKDRSDEPKYAKGSLIVPLLGTFKTACQANSVAQCIKDSFLIHSLDFIKKGDQITTFHGRTWTSTPKSARLKFMTNELQITCDCPACQNDWPTSENLKCFQGRLKSPEWMEKVKEVIDFAYNKLAKIVFSGDIRDKEQVLNDFRRIMKVIADGTDQPFRESIILSGLLLHFYFVTGNIAKMKILFSNK